MSKKGVVGDTITWFWGFLIICFFLLILFLAVLFLVSEKKLTPGEIFLNGESFYLSDVRFGMNEELNSVLNEKIDKRTLNDLLLQWTLEESDEDSLKDEMKESLRENVEKRLIEYGELTGKCYVFQAYNGDEIIFIQDFIDRKDSFVVSNYPFTQESAFGRLQQGVGRKVEVDDKTLFLKFYGGERC